VKSRKVTDICRTIKTDEEKGEAPKSRAEGEADVLMIDTLIAEGWCTEGCAMRSLCLQDTVDSNVWDE